VITQLVSEQMVETTYEKAQSRTEDLVKSIRRARVARERGIHIPGQFSEHYGTRQGNLDWLRKKILAKRRAGLSAYERQAWLVYGFDKHLRPAFIFPNGELPKEASSGNPLEAPELTDEHIERIGDALQRTFYGKVEFYHIRTGKITQVDVDALKVLEPAPESIEALVF